MDPLIPQPDDRFVVPEGLTDDERERWLVSAVFDYVNLHAMAWPAKDSNGRLVPPPDPHVLDHLARSNELVAEERINTTLAANTVAVVRRLPDCDFCGLRARYDALLTVGDRRPGAFLCNVCYSSQGSGVLGQGDAYLMTKAEVPQAVKKICNQLRADQAQPPLFDELEE